MKLIYSDKTNVWENFEEFKTEMAIEDREITIFSKKGRKPFWSMPAPRRLFLIFGSETKGLPDSILKTYPEATYYIPITTEIRCLNLSTSTNRQPTLIQSRFGWSAAGWKSPA